MIECGGQIVGLVRLYALSGHVLCLILNVASILKFLFGVILRDDMQTE